MTNMYRFRNFPMGLAFAAGVFGCSTNDGAGFNMPGGASGTAGSAPSAGNATGGGAGSMVGSSGNGGGSGAPATTGGAGAATAGSSGAAGASGASGAGGGGGGPPSTEKFSFFVTSMASMLELAKVRDPNEEEGFGGDLTYGEVGPGAGLRGADKICAVIAEKSMPGNNKRWRAFLSVTAGEDGQPVNAIERIGQGPWYDRTGRVMAMNIDGLLDNRPDGEVGNDLPNEFGVPNQQPDPNQDPVDNHDTLTGSNQEGELNSTNMGETCNDWTSKVGETGVPVVGHSWPRNGNEDQNWINEHDTGGCAPGVNIFGQGGPPPGVLTVGAGGGYGGIYCFALDP
jgi:hypothetical protein